MSDERPIRVGLLSATTAFLAWGFAPAYWRLLIGVAAPELLAHRIVWGFVLVAAWLGLTGKLRAAFRALSDRVTRRALLGSTFLIAVNWLTFIWAVNNDHVLDASLGYFINPLVNVLLGLVVLGEKLSRRQAQSVVLATLGVAILTVGLGVLPWISLVLACSFGLYGLVRKTVRTDAMSGLLIETGLLAPFAAAYIVTQELAGTGALSRGGTATVALLLLAGPITAVPLALFTVGARRLPLSTVGLLQYVAPTGQFLLAVAAYGERFTTIHAVAFAFIWIALALFTWDFRVRLLEARRAAVGLQTGDAETTQPGQSHSSRG